MFAEDDDGEGNPWKIILSISIKHLFVETLEIVPTEITSSANDPSSQNSNAAIIGKFLQNAKISTPRAKSEDPNRDRSNEKDIESLNMPFISTSDKRTF